MEGAFTTRESYQVGSPYRNIEITENPIIKEATEQLHLSHLANSKLQDKEIKKLSTMLESKDSLLMKCHTTISQMESNATGEKDRTREMEDDLLNFQQEINLLIQKLGDKNGKIEALGSRVNELETVNHTLNTRCNTIQTDMLDEGEEYAYIRQQMLIMKKDYLELLQYRELQSVCDEKENKIKGFENEISILDENATGITVQNTNMMELLRQAKEELEQKYVEGEKKRREILLLKNEKNKFQTLHEESRMAFQMFKEESDKNEEKLKLIHEKEKEVVRVEFRQREDEFRAEIKTHISDIEVKLNKTSKSRNHYKKATNKAYEEMKRFEMNQNIKLKDLQGFIAKLETHLEETRAELRSSEDQIERYENKMGTKRKSIINNLRNTEKEASRWKSDFLGLDIGNQKLKIEKKDLLEQIKIMQRTEVEYKLQLKGLQNDIINNKTKYEKEIEKQLVIINDQDDKIKTQIYNLDQKSVQLNEFLKTLSEKETKNMNVLSDLNKITDSTNIKNKSLNSELSLYKSKYHNEHEERLIAVSQLDEIKLKMHEIADKQEREIKYYKIENERKEQLIKGEEGKYQKFISNKYMNSRICERFDNIYTMLKNWIVDIHNGSSTKLTKKSFNKLYDILDEMNSSIALLTNIHEGFTNSSP